MIITAAIAVWFAATPAQQALPSPSQLSFGEAYGCSVVARVANETLFSDTPPQTDEDRNLSNSLQLIASLAATEADAAQLRDGISDANRPASEASATNALAQADEQRVSNMLVLCGRIFGVIAE